jgi:hypothetical protein
MTEIGNAPVSYGAFEVTVGHDPNVPGATDVLDAVQSARYAGIDLGLLLTGGYVEINVSSVEASQ